MSVGYYRKYPRPKETRGQSSQRESSLLPGCGDVCTKGVRGDVEVLWAPTLLGFASKRSSRKALCDMS